MSGKPTNLTRSFLRFGLITTAGAVITACEDTSAATQSNTVYFKELNASFVIDNYYPELKGQAPLSSAEVPINTNLLDNVTFYNYTNLTVNPDELAKLYSYVSTVAENPVGAEYKLFNNTLPLDIFPIELPKRTGHIFIR
ncbi:MAG: hypothetical protein UT08_C0007G0009 [Candidatus Woesebacteria bacterium GW2011_GWB1_38_8]|uniref:Uncharacterized protein n=1 Tax=Candidatus Woesebacteria bacterium GW2011_GWB1_38_8 TaxID=1618570 RepID=A0A0G0P7P0_9BACT|nr:MAG: hypothetical protein UT08_C0007G0009 [Candidatus Woesebacteria bacterium GW2011_GWB1_38_8]